MTMGGLIDATPRTASPAALSLVARLLERLHANSISYCHWKSNEHLGPAVEGITDLDVLVAREDAVLLAGLLADNGFKRFRTSAARTYPAIEDYLGFDEESGRLVHLHVHYQLTLGAQYLKGHRLPWEKHVLETRSFDAEHSVFVAAPEVELLLLAVRSVLKLRFRDRLNGGRSALNPGARREWDWLLARVQALRVLNLADHLLGPAATVALAPVLRSSAPTLRQFIACRRGLQRSMRVYGTYSPLEARARRWQREVAVVVARLRRRWLGGAVETRRTVVTGGVLVAFIGADGAGKSTMTGLVAKWLGWKVAVAATYGGSGVGSASGPRRILQRISGMLRRGGRARPSTQAATTPRDVRTTSASGSRLGVLKQVIWSLMLTRERRTRLTEAQRARNLGRVVLWDRFPQRQFPGLNDGPRLAHWIEHPSALLRAVARYEASAFEMAERCHPDVVIKLIVPFETARTRKPDTPPDQLRRKLEIVAALGYPAGTRVVEVDASQPLEAVLLDVKRIVWDSL